MKLRSVALAAAGLAAGYAAERALLGRERHSPDRGALEDFRFPADVMRHDVSTSDGGCLRVVEAGAGTPLVLLHGVSLSSLTWHYQVADLRDRYRVIAVDHRGHGESRAGAGDWTISRLALDLRELLDALDLRGAVVVGHSMGGMVALRLAVDHAATVEERLAGLVLMSTSAGPVHRLAAYDAVTRALARPAASGLRLAERMPGGAFRESDLTYLMFRLGFGSRPSPTHVEMNRMMTASNPVSGWAELMSGVISFDVEDELARIETPALVVVGSRDLLTPLAQADLMARTLPHARLEVLQGGGHMLMLERRAEVDGLLDGFAREVA
ncbi:MAG TPA: alpha/beta hydrolase [Acidimicrobiales bacterium]|nr:alpha/beta hydrolase [Acidimicrobiales bacterium]